MTIVLAGVVKNISIAMVKFSLLIQCMIWWCFSSLPAQAQAKIDFENSQIEEVINWYKTTYKSQKTLKGWTIQILSTRDRREMETELSMFRQRFPDLGIRQIYNEPYYTLKVGTFVSRMEALGLRSYLQRYYNYAILSQENVRKEDYN